MYKVTAELDYVQGHLRYGHIELEVEKETWDSMTEDEQKEYLKFNGEIVIDDYSLEDRGDIVSIEKQKIKRIGEI